LSESENRTPSFKPQFTLTILSKYVLSEQISKEIDTAIGERVNYQEHGNTFDNISHTHRYLFTFSPVSVEASKRRIQSLAIRYQNDLVIFFDQNKSFGIRRVLEQFQIIFDLFVGILLPTEATIIFKPEEDSQIKNIQKSLTSIFLNGNSSKVTLNSIKTSKHWYKATFKVPEPIKFRSNFLDFRSQNKGTVIFEDLKRKKITSYLPYTGLAGILLNIAYFRDLLRDYVDQLIMACYDLVKG
jgi:hypothetical protein